MNLLKINSRINITLLSKSNVKPTPIRLSSIRAPYIESNMISNLIQSMQDIALLQMLRDKCNPFTGRRTDTHLEAISMLPSTLDDLLEEEWGFYDI